MVENGNGVEGGMRRSVVVNAEEESWILFEPANWYHDTMERGSCKGKRESMMVWYWSLCSVAVEADVLRIEGSGMIGQS